MEIFCRLLFGHLLADFTFQSNYIAEWKRRSWVGLLVHVLIHPACYITLLWPFLGDVWVNAGPVALNGWACVVVATALHWVEDWFRVRKINRGWNDNTLFYVWDQAIHVVILFFLSPWRTQSIETQWPLLGILFVVVTHFATVTIWFIEKDIYGREYPQTEEKYISILQRLVVWLAFFLPHPWWLFILAFVMVSFFRHVWTRRIDFSWSSVAMGNALAVGCGLIARFGIGYHF
jgi:hypothetical protein